MLSSKDKGWLTQEIGKIFRDEIVPQIRQMIQEEFKEALYVEIAIEKRRKGDDEVEKGFQNVLHQLVWELPQFVGALRGVQEDGVNVFNRMRRSIELIEVMGKTLSDMESSVTTMVEFTNALMETKLLESMRKALTIEYKPGDNKHESLS